MSSTAAARPPEPAQAPRQSSAPASRPATALTLTPPQGTGADGPRAARAVSSRRDRVVVDEAAARFAERARARRRLTWRAVLVGTLVTAALGALVWLVLFSSVFALDPAKVQVTGATELVATDGLVAVVDAQAGVPLTRLDTVALRTRLLTVSGVRDVRVTRDWPDGLTVAVVPRSPVAAVPGTGGFQLLDDDGVVLGTVAAVPSGLARLAVPTGDARTLAAALTVLHALPADLAAQVATLSADTPDAVTLKLTDGVTVVWGSAEQDALKAAVLATLRSDQSLTDVHTIDVSAPTLPVVH